MMPSAPNTHLISALRDHAKRLSGEIFCGFQSGETVQEISFGQLLSRAAGYSRYFRSLGLRSSDPVFIILRHRPDLLYAFVGAMLAGCIPAILAPISEKQSAEVYWTTLRRLFRNVGAAAVVVEPEEDEAVAEIAGPLQMRVIAPVDAAVPISEIIWPEPRPDDTAFLQFSSGTTGLRKGVMLSHHIVMEQIKVYQRALGLGPGDRIVSWLPLYHDMGLIACFIIPLVTGTPIVMLDAFEWVYEPARLFEAITRHRGTLTWLPNFAFNHLCTTVPATPVYDLSSVRAFINCSEPCKIESMRRFAERFASFNVRMEQLQTCYAMAEAVFGVTQSRLGKALRTVAVDRSAFAAEQRIVPVRGEAPEASIEFVSVGPVLPGFELRIVGPDRMDLPADRVGEIAIRGPSVFNGYYRAPEASAEPFKGGWYLTGDLGFCHAGEVFVTGRSKDIVIAYGKNFYTHDIEAIVNAVDGVKPGRAVAFGVYNQLSGSEEIVVVAETAESDPQAKRQIARSVKTAVIRVLDLSVSSVELVPPQWLIKTTSGKLGRTQNREKYLAQRQGSIAAARQKAEVR